MAYILTISDEDFEDMREGDSLVIILTTFRGSQGWVNGTTQEYRCFLQNDHAAQLMELLESDGEPPPDSYMLN